MKAIMLILFRVLWIIVVYVDHNSVRQQRFNKLNPLAWIALLIYSLYAFIVGGARQWWDFIRETLEIKTP